ncbi:MAG: tRNA (adenosine(37)-N6)-threonylcarbamoyltransferase complex dimerization subunit type 1 TsaB [Alphaproteobacteria bacterium]|nr:tRNA (adenosine(37)-N6)-threonylcarbamoyltransferase complex dimerization subunit type 1 TsaB [Alphaproteobacteria bacterium]
MFTLAFDTTANFCSVALFEDLKKIECFEQEMDFGQAEKLMVEIDNMLKKHNMVFKDLSLVVVCTGPGSFTGVRSSVSAARAFKLACKDVCVAGVNAFDAYVADVTPDESAQINAVIIETKREDFYVAYYDNCFNKLMPPTTAFYDDIIKFLSSKNVTLIGDGVERFLNKPSGLSLHAIKMKQKIDIEKLALVGIKKYAQKTTDFPKPLYLKAPDVCIK